ncbi:MAG: hypothetical protein JWN48_4692 [Myxococcaceae bacterium]|nr:hypothetical protein [Myxococcaceae bacterium]
MTCARETVRSAVGGYCQPESRPTVSMLGRQPQSPRRVVRHSVPGVGAIRSAGRWTRNRCMGPWLVTTAHRSGLRRAWPRQRDGTSLARAAGDRDQSRPARRSPEEYSWMAEDGTIRALRTGAEGSGQPGSNRRHSAWEADALPTELCPHASADESSRMLARASKPSTTRMASIRAESSLTRAPRAALCGNFAKSCLLLFPDVRPTLR